MTSTPNCGWINFVTEDNNELLLRINFFCSICLCSLIILFQEQQRANIRRNSGACTTVIKKPPAASQDSALKHPRTEKRPLISGEEASSRHKVRATLQLYLHNSYWWMRINAVGCKKLIEYIKCDYEELLWHKNNVPSVTFLTFLHNKSIMGSWLW